MNDVPPEERTQTQRVRLLVVFLAATVFLQRFRLPVGQLPLLLPVGLVLTGWGLRQRLLAFDRTRVTLGLGALIALSASAALALFSGGAFGIQSFLFVVLTYLPFVLTVTGGANDEVFRRVASAFVTILAVAAALCVLEFLAELAGVTSADLITSAVPGAFRLLAYNTDAPLHYGSPILRSNGLVFLEPSFASQFMGLGILTQLWLRRGLGPIPLFAAAMACTIAGTGPTLLLSGLAVAVAVRQQRLLGRLGPLVAAGALIALLSPLGTLVAARATEGGGAGTSTGQRFQLPFTLIVPGWLNSAQQFLVGGGPGSVQAFLDRTAPQSAVVPLVPVKLLYEYGLLGTLPFLIFVLWVSIPHSRAPSITAGLLVAYLLLSGGLVQPISVYPVLVLCVWCPRMTGERFFEPEPPPPHRDRLPQATTLAVAARAGAATNQDRFTRTNDKLAAP